MDDQQQRRLSMIGVGESGDDSLSERVEEVLAERFSGPVITTISTREVYRNPWMSVREDEIEHPDGTPGVYGYIQRADFVLVIPEENDGFHLVEEYRYPIRRRSWSFPQGSAEAPTRQDEARTELAEETGLRADDMRFLGRLDNSHGLSDQSMHVFVATGLTPGETAREATEQDMRQKWVSRAQFEQMILRGDVTDASSVAAYGLLRLRG
ncbi:NUDIX domain-containing protein [Herbidospora yilanensis]|uniref:NUDIX domain-containing protein n=1 Tax=Herbidospora yilanensis TaxID=354426 RepID=UPI000ADA0F6C|nr:NUDIX hydrolase [Herbidospora yilanensis]